MRQHSFGLIEFPIRAREPQARRRASERIAARAKCRERVAERIERVFRALCVR